MADSNRKPFFLEKRHKILEVHANLLQCQKGTDELKVWKTLL